MTTPTTDVVVPEALVEKAARVEREHGFTYSNIGGICPECGHVYFEKPPGAYMDPDLDWLEGAIAEHRIRTALAAVLPDVREELAQAGEDYIRNEPRPLASEVVGIIRTAPIGGQG